MIFIFSFSHTHQYNTGSRNNGSNKPRDFEKRRNNLSFRQKKKEKEKDGKSSLKQIFELKNTSVCEMEKCHGQVSNLPPVCLSLYLDISTIDIFPFLFFSFLSIIRTKFPSSFINLKQLDRRTGKPSRGKKKDVSTTKLSFHSKTFSSSFNKAASKTNLLTEYHRASPKKAHLSLGFGVSEFDSDRERGNKEMKYVKFKMNVKK